MVVQLIVMVNFLWSMVVQLIVMVNFLWSVVVQLIVMVAVTLLRYVHRPTKTKGGYSRYTLNDDDDDDDDCSKLTRKYISTRKEEGRGEI